MVQATQSRHADDSTVVVVEPDGDAAHVAVRVGGAFVGGNNREAQEQRRALANFVEEGGLGPLGDAGRTSK